MTTPIFSPGPQAGITFPQDFANDYSIQAAINRAVAALPADHTYALVAHVDTQTGAALSGVMKMGDEWKIELGIVKDWGGPFRGGAEVIYSH